MFQYHCLNPIAQKGLDIFDDNYKKADYFYNTFLNLYNFFY